MANLAPVPDGLTDEEVLMCPDIMSTGFSGAESGNVRIGDTVAVFAQGPIGLCATAGASCRARPRSSRSTAAGTSGDGAPAGRRPRRRLQLVDPVEEIMRLTDGRGVDVAIEALGTQTTFEGAPTRAAAGRHAVEPGRLLVRPDASRSARSPPGSRT